MIRILVPIKRVPDHEAKVKINSQGDSIVTDGIKWITNPFDEIAIEEAVRIKEKFSDVEILACSIGPAQATEQLRTALAIGADRALLYVTNEFVDSDIASRVLMHVFNEQQCQLVLMGKQAIDSDANQTGQLLAQRLNLPQATFASKVELEQSWKRAKVTREVDGGLQTIAVTLPAVITTDLRLNEPRYPSLPNIVKAKKKPLEEFQLSEVGIDLAPKVRIVGLELPSTRQAGVRVGSVKELVDKLVNEAKVL